MSHADARLTVHGRAELDRRVPEQGPPVAYVVVEMNVSRATGHTWSASWRAERSPAWPTASPAVTEQHVLVLRSARGLGPARIGPLVGLAPSRVQAVLALHGMHRLAWLEPRPDR